MSKTEQIAKLLHEAAETHHKVYRITDGDDPDWATWYAEWLLNFSELPDVLGTKPIRSHLIYWLVQLDHDFVEKKETGKWEDYYAEKITAEFGGQVSSSESPSPEEVKAADK